MKHLIAATLVSFTLGCHAPGGITGPPRTEVEAPAPTDLEQIVQLYQQHAGITVTYDEATGQRLRSIDVKSIGPQGDVLWIDAHADDAQSKVFEVWPLRFADAPKLANILANLVRSASAAGSGSEVRIMADERTNSLLVLTDVKHVEPLKELVARLDIEQLAGS